jgi:hypothetical protein
MSEQSHNPTDIRMDAIRLKDILGAPLTEQELMCLQIEENGFGCSGATPVRVALNPYDQQAD